MFTTAYNIAQIDDVFVDGAVYTAFTYVGNVITLTDAPTVSIYVDYYDSPPLLPTDTIAASTLKTYLEQELISSYR